eukprot:scaffold32972_cov28-Tisochrysis_lutea.AAC.11
MESAGESKQTGVKWACCARCASPFDAGIQQPHRHDRGRLLLSNQVKGSFDGRQWRCSYAAKWQRKRDCSSIASPVRGPFRWD